MAFEPPNLGFRCRVPDDESSVSRSGDDEVSLRVTCYAEYSTRMAFEQPKNGSSRRIPNDERLVARTRDNEVSRGTPCYAPYTILVTFQRVQDSHDNDLIVCYEEAKSLAGRADDEICESAVEASCSCWVAMRGFVFVLGRTERLSFLERSRQSLMPALFDAGLICMWSARARDDVFVFQHDHGQMFCNLLCHLFIHRWRVAS